MTTGLPIPTTMQGERPTRDQVRAEFRHFAQKRAGTYAPLYARLASAIEDDPIVLDIAIRARSGQSRPDLLLAIIHEYLIRDPGHPAARFYPSLTATPDVADPAPHVLALAHSNRDELVARIENRLVQTNEVGRCTFLAPALQFAIEEIVDQAGRKDAEPPVALLEIGASAGLNLLPDLYCYRYSFSNGTGEMITEGAYGQSNQPILDCELRDRRVPLLNRPSAIGWRAGLDLNPLRIADADDRRWLQALVWPDHRARARRLDAAIENALRNSELPTVHKGDAATDLPEIVRQIPTSMHLVLYHCAVTAHMTPSTKARFEQAVLDCSGDRPISWIQAEPRADNDPRRLRLLTCSDRRISREYALGSYHPHGEWLSWNYPQ